MARVRGKNTGIEMQVRSALFRAGFRFRLHVRDLPGKPDLVFPRLRLAVFVNGCFWHQHGCSRSRPPQTNADFWDRKLRANVLRDQRVAAELRSLAWEVRIVWQCSLKDDVRKLEAELRTRRERYG